jgi:uncharacterized protein (TIGR03437 family)
LFYAVRKDWRRLAALAIIIFGCAVLSQPAAQTRPRAVAHFGIAAHDGNEGGKKGLTREERAREAWVWHRAKMRRNEAEGAAPLESQDISSDINDISVMQGDNRLITPPNAFDLNGRSVQFTPAGAGYTITNSNAAFDTNLGTKLDLTAPPAINPRPEPEPGDDAYILQDLGFNFSFFGASYTQVAVGSNGFLTFRPSGVSNSSFNLNSVDSTETLAAFQNTLPRIAPYWHDLDATAQRTTGNNGIFIRKESNRVLVTWNNIRDFPNDPQVDNGVHRFQVSLFNDGRIVLTYASAQLTSQALAGITPGASPLVPALVDLDVPPPNAFSGPVGEFFSTATRVDYFGAVQAFYSAHPGRDVYDFVYLVTDFNFDLGGDAFAFYSPLRNDAQGIGQPVGDSDPDATLGSRKLQGVLNLSNLSTQYPDSPITRFLGSNHALSIMGQEQGHRWLAYVKYPGNDNLLLGRDDAHWSFFFNIESTISSAAARRSSSAEGNVWRDNGNGSFTSLNLIDGYSRLDQYLMGLRPPGDVPDTFVIANPSNTSGRTRESGPTPNVTVNGTRQNVTINQIIQANGARTPNASTAQKNFRAAVVLLVRQGTQPSQVLLDKVTRYRLAWESYFAQSTDFLASMNTGLADQTTSRVIAASSAASFLPTLAPAEIAALFGQGLTAGATAVATTQPLPTQLAGTEVRINGVAAPLFFASPGQINFEVPRATVAATIFPSVQSSTALIEVYSNGQLIRAGAFQVAPVVPAVFTLTSNGSGAAAAIDALTGALAPFNAKQSNGQPNIISVFGTGLGADATDASGNVNASVQATIDGAPATVDYAGRAPNFTGLNQFNIIFPANITPGTHTLVITRNGIQSQAVTITVR